jgi:AAA15 family ATPase/GTPase
MSEKMLTKLRLQNFRCFKDHVVPLHPTTIIVGRNNAGKSTIVEALRLVSIIVNRYQFLNFSDVPDWLEEIVGFPFDFIYLLGILKDLKKKYDFFARKSYFSS